ncbi:MAG: hypothetical protein LIO65_08405 [Odoribacter sp.]|nr:hypothetical protein [Odoribacter sp.]
MMKPALIIGLALVCLGCKSKTEPNNVWEQATQVLEQIKASEFPNKTFDIREYGAQEGEVSTEAIAKAIDACNQAGGGMVIIPAGEFYTGAITLKSNVNLHISEGATLKFSTNPKDYMPFVLTRWEGLDCYNYQPLIYAYEAENIAITGKGVLDGQADRTHWWSWKGQAHYGWEEGMLSQLHKPEGVAGRIKLAEMEKQSSD